MPDIAIKVEGIGKKYRIGKKKSGELRETFGNLIRSFKSSANSQQPTANSHFWALKDISFEVKQGEAVGIIGRNGAGKSTLLKVLSRITRPTTGRFEINGRVSSLLEVGTGFHPELTGRENIFLNGTILGMRRAEIKAKFDEIIAFSGVEEFIDTPVKHYSSGMKVRLAFSVAAHLEPEILIIDEVLAVGDAEFQKKCLGKMEDVTGEGRAVLFVSHNMGAVRSLCNRAFMLYQGQVSSEGQTSNVIDYYLTYKSKVGGGLKRWQKGSIGINEVDLFEMYIKQNDQIRNSVSSSFSIEISLRYKINYSQKLSIGFQLFTQTDIPVLSTINWKESSIGDSFAERELSEGVYVTYCTIPANFLNEENYKIHLVLMQKGNKVLYFEKDILAFSVENDGNMRQSFHEKWIGVVRPKLEWYTENIYQN